MSAYSTSDSRCRPAGLSNATPCWCCAGAAMAWSARLPDWSISVACRTSCEGSPGRPERQRSAHRNPGLAIPGSRTQRPDLRAAGHPGGGMRVARLHAAGDVRLHDEPEPSPGTGETLVRVSAVGLCGSDLHWFSAAGIGDAVLTKPLVLGHELAGVTDSGQRVAVDPAIPCEACEFCREGNSNLCARLRFAGHATEDGGLREALAWPSRRLVPLPPSLSHSDGAMLEPLGVAIHAVDLGKIRLGMRVGVFGCGPIGLLVVQVARAAGATEVVVTEPLPHRLG